MFRKFSAALLVAASVVPVASASAAPTVVDRDEFSTTTRLADGRLKTSLSSEPVNYETSDGWKPIDTDLDEKGDGTLRAAAVDGDVMIPATLGDPVELAHDGREVSFRLIGASGDEADVDGAEATFTDALAGVDARYAATATGVKETLVLASSSTPNVFKYDVRAATSWSAAVVDGSVVLSDGAGHERYRIDAPLAWDSAADPAYTNDLVLSVAKVSAGRWTVTLRPNVDWLDDADREYRVSIDPDFSWSSGTTNFHGAIDTYLASGDQANSVFSSASYLQTGHYNRVYKSLLKFDIAAAIPTNAVVSSATFKAYAPPATPKALASHSLRTVTADWDANANWNRRKVGVSWGTSGGDVSSNSAQTSTAVNVQTNPGWYSWTAPLATVQGWVDGSLSNYGFQLATNSGAPSGNSYVWASTEASTSSTFPADSTKWPTLDVTWSQSGDTVAPPQPDGLEIADVDALERSATLAFDAPADEGPTGATVSGLDRAEVRFSKNGGSLSAWDVAGLEGEHALPNVVAGDEVAVQVRTIDGAGNISAVSSATLEVWSEGEPPIDPDFAQFFADEHGVSLAVATAWLETQDKTHDLQDALAAMDGAEGVAGFWFDNAARKVHVQVTDAAATGPIRFRADQLGLLESIEIDPVPYSQDYLASENVRVASDFESLIHAEQLMLSSDQVEGSLVWLLDESVSTATKQLVAEAASTTTPIAEVVEVSAGSLQTKLDACNRVEPAQEAEWIADGVRSWAACSGAFRGGVRIQAKDQNDKWQGCSAGFNALTRDTGDPVLLTAGHCRDDVGSSARTWYMTATQEADEHTKIGNSGRGSRVVVPEGYPGRVTDVGYIKYSSPPSTLKPIYYDRRSTTRKTRNSASDEENRWRPFKGAKPSNPIRSVRAALKGELVCTMGALTGKSCGTVLRRSEPGNEVLWVRNRTGRGGDSGSPIVDAKGRAAPGYAHWPIRRREQRRRHQAGRQRCG